MDHHAQVPPPFFFFKKKAHLLIQVFTEQSRFQPPMGHKPTEVFNYAAYIKHLLDTEPMCTYSPGWAGGVRIPDVSKRPGWGLQ